MSANRDPDRLGRLPTWARRVRKSKIRRLYETDARGIYDEDLLDDVGCALLARCESFVAANQARAGKAPCPCCGCVVEHAGRKDELLRCGCGWQLTWGDYFRTMQHKQLSGAEPVLGLFGEFASAFPKARTPRQKMLLIDRLIHGFHWYCKRSLDGGQEASGPTRPVAVNLIQGRMKDVAAFLDDLTYSRKSTPGTRDNLAQWRRNIDVHRHWFAHRAENR